tara:strand:- start:1528 stop:4371 length:2844 start_codon:yes stop_codon:yes gene_type:complete
MNNTLRNLLLESAMTVLLLEHNKENFLSLINAGTLSEEDSSKILSKKGFRPPFNNDIFRVMAYNTLVGESNHSVDDIIGSFTIVKQKIIDPYLRGQLAVATIPGMGNVDISDNIKAGMIEYDDCMKYINFMTATVIRTKVLQKLLNAGFAGDSTHFDVVYEDNNWIVCYPKTYQGSITLARMGPDKKYYNPGRAEDKLILGTMGWCTSVDSGSNMFMNYHRKMNLHMYYFTRKNGYNPTDKTRKFCVSVEKKKKGHVNISQKNSVTVDADNSDAGINTLESVIQPNVIAAMLKDAARSDRLIMNEKEFFGSVSLIQFLPMERAAKAGEEADLSFFMSDVRNYFKYTQYEDLKLHIVSEYLYEDNMFSFLFYEYRNKDNVQGFIALLDFEKILANDLLHQFISMGSSAGAGSAKWHSPLIAEFVFANDTTEDSRSSITALAKCLLTPDRFASVIDKGDPYELSILAKNYQILRMKKEDLQIFLNSLDVNQLVANVSFRELQNMSRRNYYIAEYIINNDPTSNKKHANYVYDYGKLLKRVVVNVMKTNNMSAIAKIANNRNLNKKIAVMLKKKYFSASAENMTYEQVLVASRGIKYDEIIDMTDILVRYMTKEIAGEISHELFRKNRPLDSQPISRELLFKLIPYQSFWSMQDVMIHVRNNHDLTEIYNYITKSVKWQRASDNYRNDAIGNILQNTFIEKRLITRIYSENKESFDTLKINILGNPKFLNHELDRYKELVDMSAIENGSSRHSTRILMNLFDNYKEYRTEKYFVYLMEHGHSNIKLHMIRNMRREDATPKLVSAIFKNDDSIISRYTSKHIAKLNSNQVRYVLNMPQTWQVSGFINRGTWVPDEKSKAGHNKKVYRKIRKPLVLEYIKSNMNNVKRLVLMVVDHVMTDDIARILVKHTSAKIRSTLAKLTNIPEDVITQLRADTSSVARKNIEKSHPADS